MKKRLWVLITAALCVLSLTAGVFASGVIREIKAQLRPDFTVKVDGEVKTFKNAQGDKVYPVLYDGTTYLPLRAIGELMGKTVYWYEDDKLIELKEEKSTVTDADVIVTGKEKDKKDKEKDKKDIPVFIGEEKAKSIALQKAGLSADKVIFDRVELDIENGVACYEIEFKNGRTEYDAEISAIDGKIIKWKSEIDD